MPDSRRTLLLILALLLPFLLTACETTHYIFHPPASDTGRICVTQCGATREFCRGNEMQRAQREKASCERSADAAFYACMAQPVPREREKDKTKDCEKQRKSCWTSENTWRCDTDYRECYVNCGGMIEEYKE
ncbi:MAG: hypothetical protein KBD60_09295 [Sterolibacterium sp.]|jgi:hypothetical protein|nr:hypothetical protein [Sterolibacterium sp.]